MSFSLSSFLFITLDEELQPKRKKQKQSHLMLPNAPSCEYILSFIFQ